MILLLDIGNTRIKWRYVSSAGEVLRGAAEHDAASIPTGLAAASGSWCPPGRVVAANVAGAAMQEAAAAWVRELWDLQFESVQVTARRGGVTCGYDDPAQLGVDRWMAMIAARARHRGSVCVVDCGTAVTVDAVSAQGLHVGGAIFPGVRLMRDSLAVNTGRLPSVEGVAAHDALGRSTRQCILFGTQLAVASSVNGLCARIENQLGDGTRFYLTGGDGARLRSHLEGDYSLVPELVLDGLAVVAAEAAAE